MTWASAQLTWVADVEDVGNRARKASLTTRPADLFVSCQRLNSRLHAGGVCAITGGTFQKVGLEVSRVGWARAGPDVRERSVRLLERAVPDLDEASNSRLKGREVSTIDAALCQPGRKRLEQSLPFVDSPRLGWHRDLHSADRRLLNLDHASHDPDAAQLLTVCSAGFPCAVPAR